jgi:hypothetical protein
VADGTYYATITAIRDYGTIVAVHLTRGGPVFFDHRPFGWLVEDRCGGDASQLIGVKARERDIEGVQTLQFEDEEGEF